MAKIKIEIKIRANGEPDHHCLPSWIAQDILLKIEADKIKSKADKIPTDKTLVDQPPLETINSLS